MILFFSLCMNKQIVKWAVKSAVHLNFNTELEINYWMWSALFPTIGKPSSKVPIPMFYDKDP